MWRQIFKIFYENKKPNMNTLDNTTLMLCIDKDHIEELKFAWKTWEFFKPEIVNIKRKLLIYDSAISERLSELSFVDSSFQLHSFNNKRYYQSQRDAMLTSWFEGVRLVQTKFYFKIDTDCFATNGNKNWIQAISDADQYKIIASPWGYTKNPQRIHNLELWGDNAKNISNFPRLNLIAKPGSDKIIHPRIISFLSLMDTAWTLLIAEECWNNDHYILPDPSQDTFTWYCAQRRQDPIKRIRFKKFGFSHTRLKKIKNQLLQYGDFK